MRGGGGGIPEEPRWYATKGVILMWKATFTNIAKPAGNATRLFQMSPPECHQAQISPYDVATKRSLPVKFVSARMSRSPACRSRKIVRDESRSSRLQKVVSDRKQFLLQLASELPQNVEREQNIQVQTDMSSIWNVAPDQNVEIKKQPAEKNVINTEFLQQDNVK